MPEPSVRKAGLWLFIAKFSIWIVLLLSIWWGFLMLAYAWLVGTACAVLSMHVDDIQIAPEGLFNTETMLTFVVAGQPHAFPVALLVTNIPPFVALVLATSGLALAKRLRAVLYGVGILFTSHVLFISVLMRFQEQLKAHPEVPTAIMQVIIATLPFILWIRLAYWDRVSSLLREGAEETNKP